MTELPAVVALVVAAVNGAAGLLGAWRWWRVEPSRAFWVLCRAGQVAAAVQAAVAGVLAATGFHPDDGLYWLYALLPLAVSFVAEQLRVTAAQTVLDARGLEDAQAVGTLDDAAQRSVVLAIVRREMGTMAASCLVVAFLALRAAGTA
ncbi:MAG: hypothetical protein QOC78_3506 [Solirubrobacteraceae bacterium]|jgi:hypothetical protein|nr:hypothetical protein [Solirubrobacteraceae bacterium]